MAATKKQLTTVPEDTTQINTILYDETFELRSGGKLRMVVDMATIMIKAKDYTEAFSDARGLPFDLDNFSPRDPIVRYLVTRYEPLLKAGMFSEQNILQRARSYYERALNEAQVNAYLLAFFDSDENVFNNVPTPYEKQSFTQSRFIEPMPEVEKNLAMPIEYTLKQILDTMLENPRIMARFQQIVEELSVRINRVISGGLVETDEKGFQPEPTDGAVS